MYGQSIAHIFCKSMRIGVWKKCPKVCKNVSAVSINDNVNLLSIKVTNDNKVCFCNSYRASKLNISARYSNDVVNNFGTPLSQLCTSESANVLLNQSK